MSIKDTLQFGLGMVAIIGEDKVSRAGVLASFAANVAAPLVPTMGGAASAPIAAREGRSESSFTIGMNQRPAWVDELANAGDYTAEKDDTAPVPYDLVGNGAVDITVSFKANTAVVPGTYMVTVGTAPSATIEYIGGYEPPFTNGESVTLDLATTAKDVGSSGIQVALKAGKSADNADVWLFDVFKSATKDGAVISVPQVVRGKIYRMLAFSAPGGPDDNMNVYDFPRVMFGGCNISMTDNEPVSGVEITGLILASLDGKPTYTRTVVPK